MYTPLSTRTNITPVLHTSTLSCLDAVISEGYQKLEASRKPLIDMLGILARNVLLVPDPVHWSCPGFLWPKVFILPDRCSAYFSRRDNTRTGPTTLHSSRLVPFSACSVPPLAGCCVHDPFPCFRAGPFVVCTFSGHFGTCCALIDSYPVTSRPALPHLRKSPEPWCGDPSPRKLRQG